MFFLVLFSTIVAGFALRMATSIMYGVRGPARGDATYAILRVVSWVLIGGPLLVWSVLPLIVPRMGATFCLLLWVILGFAVVDAVRSSREMYRRMNAKLLAIALREGQLSQINELMDKLGGGWFVGESALGLSRDLARGVPLYESVAHHRSALPRIAPAYAAVGTLASAEPEALDEASRPDDSGVAAAWRNWVDYVAYGIAMLLAIGALLSTFGIYIIPQFHEIFYEFGLELPPATAVLVNLSENNMWVWWLGFLLILAVLVTILVIGVMYLFDMRPIGRLTDRVFRAGHLAHVLRMVALGIEHRVELPRLFYALSVTYPVASLRSRIASCYTDVSIGRALPGVMETHGLVTRNEMGLIETAAKVGNLPWSLRQIAARKESQMVAWMTVLSRIAYPVIVLGIALVVAFIVISLFIPLVKLVEGLS